MEAFAKKIGVSKNTYQHYEYATRKPSLSFIIKLNHALGVSADWLLGLDSSREKAAHVTATGHAVAANHSTVTTAAENSRLLSIIESQQRVIENLSKRK